MPNLSKYFYLAIKNKTCADFIHPNLTCLQSARELAVSGWIGAMKFYFPGCFVSSFLCDCDGRYIVFVLQFLQF
jgi:hypothetical protein